LSVVMITGGAVAARAPTVYFVICLPHSTTVIPPCSD